MYQDAKFNVDRFRVQMLGMWIQASLSVNTLQYCCYLHGS